MHRGTVILSAAKNLPVPPGDEPRSCQTTRCFARRGGLSMTEPAQIWRVLITESREIDRGRGCHSGRPALSKVKGKRRISFYAKQSGTARCFIRPGLTAQAWAVLGGFSMTQRAQSWRLLQMSLFLCARPAHFSYGIGSIWGLVGPLVRGI